MHGRPLHKASKKKLCKIQPSLPNIPLSRARRRRPAATPATSPAKTGLDRKLEASPSTLCTQTRPPESSRTTLGGGERRREGGARRQPPTPPTPPGPGRARHRRRDKGEAQRLALLARGAVRARVQRRKPPDQRGLLEQPPPQIPRVANSLCAGPSVWQPEAALPFNGVPLPSPPRDYLFFIPTGVGRYLLTCL